MSSACCAKICTRKVRQFLAGGTASHGSLVLGVVLSWGPATFKELVEEMPDISYNKLWMFAVLGILMGLVPSGYSADKFGRRLTLLLLCFPALVGWICIIFASSPELIYFGRVLTGFSGGGFSVVVPLYLGEIAEDKLRGMLGCMFYQQMLGGALLGLMASAQGFSWRFLTGKAIFIPFIYFILMYFMPESPMYLMQNGRSTQALNSLKWLRATKENETEDVEFKEMEQALESGGSWNLSILRPKTLLSSTILKPIGICMVLMIFNAFSGVGILTLYTMAFTTPIISLTNNSSNFLYGIRQMYMTQGPGLQLSPTALGIILTLVPLITIGISSHLIAIKKRRPILITSTLFMSFCLLLQGIFSYMQNTAYDINESTLYWLKFSTFVGLFLTSSFSLAPIPWLMMGEFMPTRARGIGAVLVAGTFWIASFLFTYLISILVYLVGNHFCFWFSAVVCATAAIFEYFSVPETSGKSFSDIQEIFNSRRRLSIQM